MRPETRNAKGTRCYLGRYQNKDRDRIMRALMAAKFVITITDHGPHLKVITRRGAPPRVVGVSWRFVKDRTTHWDRKYWDFAMAVGRHATLNRRDKMTSLRVMIHYLFNLFGLPEAEALELIAAERRYLIATVTDRQAHGWELDALGMK